MPTLKSYLLSTPSTEAKTPTTKATPATPAIADLLTFLTVPNIATAPDIARINEAVNGNYKLPLQNMNDIVHKWK